MLPNRDIYGRKYNKEEFVEKSNKVHNNKYTYPGVYVNSRDKIEILQQNYRYTKK